MSSNAGSIARRRGATATEYALLLAVVACSALFGARLIMSSNLWRFDTLNASWGVAAAGRHGAGAGETQIAQAPTSREAISGTSTAWQIGSLVVLIGLGIVASVGLLRSHRRRVAMAEPEFVEPTGNQSCAERFAIKRQEIYRVLCRNLKHLLTSNVTVGHILSELPVTVRPTMAIEELTSLMKENQIRHLLVCGADGTLLGVISDRDVTAGRAKTAGEIMSPHPCTVPAATDIRTAITMMLKHRFSSLPVVDEGRLAGIITVTDLIIMLQVTLQLLDKLRADIVNGTLFDPENATELVASN